MFPLTTRTKRPRRSGFVLVTMALATLGTVAAVGLSVDVGRMYIVRNELQAFSDAASMAAALKLNGQPSGITAAKNVVTISANKWHFGTTAVSTSTVLFAKASDGPWDSSPGTAAGYAYAKVTGSASVPIYLMSVFAGTTSATVSAKAIAAQVPRTTFHEGLGPLTVVSTNTTGPNFGLAVGTQFAIHWSNKQVSNCAGDSAASRAAAAAYWGSSERGYWGGNGASDLSAMVLNGVQHETVSAGDPIDLTNGDKNSLTKALDDRVNEDGDSTDNNVTAYLANPAHNGRRLFALPIVNPTATGTYVVGYGTFLLLSSGNPSSYYRGFTGNDSFCAAYAGTYVFGSTDPGSVSSTGASRVALLQ